MSFRDGSDAGSNADSKGSSGYNEDPTPCNQKQNSQRTSSERSQESAEQQTSEGGIRAWLRVLGAFLVLTNTMGMCMVSA